MQETLKTNGAINNPGMNPGSPTTKDRSASGAFSTDDHRFIDPPSAEKRGDPLFIRFEETILERMQSAHHIPVDHTIGRRDRQVDDDKNTIILAGGNTLPLLRLVRLYADAELGLHDSLAGNKQLNRNREKNPKNVDNGDPVVPNTVFFGSKDQLDRETRFFSSYGSGIREITWGRNYQSRYTQQDNTSPTETQNTKHAIIRRLARQYGFIGDEKEMTNFYLHHYKAISALALFQIEISNILEKDDDVQELKKRRLEELKRNAPKNIIPLRKQDTDIIKFVDKSPKAA